MRVCMCVVCVYACVRGGIAAHVDEELGGGVALVVDLDGLLQVGVAASLWRFVEVVQAEPGPRVGHVACKRVLALGHRSRLQHRQAV